MGDQVAVNGSNGGRRYCGDRHRRRGGIGRAGLRRAHQRCGATAGGDRLTVNGNEGDGSLKAANGVEGRSCSRSTAEPATTSVSAERSPHRRTWRRHARWRRRQRHVHRGRGQAADILLGLNTTNGLVQFESSNYCAILSTIAVTGCRPAIRWSASTCDRPPRKSTVWPRTVPWARLYDHRSGDRRRHPGLDAERRTQWHGNVSAWISSGARRLADRQRC